MKHQTGSFVARPCCGNVWKSWRAPVPPIVSEDEGTKFTANILNAVISPLGKV